MVHEDIKAFLQTSLADAKMKPDIKKQFQQVGFSGIHDIVLFLYYSRMHIEEILGVHWAELNELFAYFKSNGIAIDFPYNRNIRLGIIEACKDIFISNQIDVLFADETITKVFSEHHIVTVGDYFGYTKKYPQNYVQMKRTCSRQIILLNVWLGEFGFDIDREGWRDQ